MNREIKFRAWDYKENKMTRVFDLEEANELLSYFDSRTPMQYTGLKDKNGVEIYEGDIVNNYLTTGRIEKLVLTDDIFFIVNRMKEILKSQKYNLDHKFEVIGNIYQHPELLK